MAGRGPPRPGSRPAAKAVSHPLFIMKTMKQQLTLVVDSASQWHLDEHTRRIGRDGIASARQVLQEARRRRLTEQQQAA